MMLSRQTHGLAVTRPVEPVSMAEWERRVSQKLLSLDARPNF
jgi:hypothetical protein